MNRSLGLFFINLFLAALCFPALAEENIVVQGPGVVVVQSDPSFGGQNSPTAHYSLCGNGRTDEGYELCDGSDPHSDYPGICAEDCQSSCGDGIKQDVEECDEGANNGKTMSFCTIDCKKRFLAASPIVNASSSTPSPSETPPSSSSSTTDDVALTPDPQNGQVEANQIPLPSSSSAQSFPGSSLNSGGCSMSPVSFDSSFFPWAVVLGELFPIVVVRRLKS